MDPLGRMSEVGAAAEVGYTAICPREPCGLEQWRRAELWALERKRRREVQPLTYRLVRPWQQLVPPALPWARAGVARVLTRRPWMRVLAWRVC